MSSATSLLGCVGRGDATGAAWMGRGATADLLGGLGGAQPLDPLRGGMATSEQSASPEETRDYWGEGERHAAAGVRG
jgi:hypothetical protein